jgi:hypothetical protein
LRPCAGHGHGHDALRLQRLNSDTIELDRIVCDSAFAKRLREFVSRDRDRVERTVT